MWGLFKFVDWFSKMKAIFLNWLVEEEQARDRYLRRLADRSQLHGSICSASDIPSGPLLSPGIDPIAMPVPPPPSPEVPYASEISVLQLNIDVQQVVSYSLINKNKYIKLGANG
jgi:hypothetical protein